MAKSAPPLLPPQLNLAVAAGWVCSIVVSIGTLLWAVDSERHALGLATVPFGWNRLIVVHALATLPLSWWLARMMGRGSRWNRPASVWLCAGLSLAFAVLVGCAGPVIASALDSGELKYAHRMFARILWCVALQTPWCLLGLVMSPVAGTRWTPRFSAKNLLALSIVIAVGVPLSYMAVFLDQQTAAAREAWSQMRLVDARLLMQRLSDAGSSTSVGQRALASDRGNVRVAVTPARALADLSAACAYLQQQIDALVSQPIRDKDRMKLARCYLALNRHDEAERALRPMADRDATAAYALATLLRDRGRNDEARHWATTALRQTQTAAPTQVIDADRRDALAMNAYELLAMLAGDTADFKTAERHLLDALQKLPTYRAHIHSRLAKHYEFIGDLTRARAHEQQAALASPQQFPPPESLLSKFLATGAPIGLARPRSSQYK